MTIKKYVNCVMAVAILFFAPMICSGAVVSTLKNTGEDVLNPPTAFGTPDGNYAASSGTAVTIAKQAAVWVDPGTDAEWIWTDDGMLENQDVTFTLPLSVTLAAGERVFFSGEWASDNGSEVWLVNGQTSTMLASKGSIGYTSLDPFSFQIDATGSYDVEFRVNNERGPAGLLVTNWEATTIPEPMSLAVWSILGMLGLIAYRRRRG